MARATCPTTRRHSSPRSSATSPIFHRSRYGVIALGDRTYTATFCFGGKRFDALLQSLGAQRIGEPMLHDASAGTIPEEVAVDWAAEWIESVPDARDEAA